MRETEIGKRREILIQFRSVDAISTLQTMMWAVCVCVWSKWVRDRKEHAAGREEALSLYLFFREAKVNSFHVDDKPYAVPLQQPIESTWIGHILVVRRYVNRIGRFQCVEHTYPQITYAHTHTHLSRNERECTRLWNTISTLLKRSLSVIWNTMWTKRSSVLSNYYSSIIIT